MEATSPDFREHRSWKGKVTSGPTSDISYVNLEKKRKKKDLHQGERNTFVWKTKNCHLNTLNGAALQCPGMQGQQRVFVGDFHKKLLLEAAHCLDSNPKLQTCSDW